ncbi:MAG: outer membrane protein transport protein [Limnohabitans sp.]|nr:outer membrane protein transport protein [Limnohabitans sp.]
MIKKIILGSLFLFSLQTFAQEGSASPYSFYGIGDMKFKGSIENRSMGGMSVLADSIHNNLQNPASISSLKLTTFSVAGTQSFITLENASQSEKAKRTYLDYLTLAIPAGKKWGFNFGLMPISSVGYRIESTNTSNGEVLRFNGKGGINKVFASAGYEINKKFSIGAELGYNFGKLEFNTAFYKNLSIQSGTRLLTTSTIGGISLNLGALYKTKINDLDFSSSLTFSPSINLKSKNTRDFAPVEYTISGAELIVGSTYDIPTADSTIKLPAKFSLGAGVGNIKKWFVGFESNFNSASDFGKIYNNSAIETSFEASQKLSIGGYYIPKYNSFSNYLEKVTYRAGLRYENTGLILNKQSIADKAFTLGLGLPIPGGFSNINIGVELGSRGTTNAGLIKENYTNIFIGLSFTDRWFIKRKYD